MARFLSKALSLLKWIVVPGEYGDMPESEIVRRRKRKTRYIVIGATVLFIAMTVGSIMLQSSDVDAPISNDIAVALILNLNVILLIVMVLLVIRNLIKLYMERRGRVAGSKFQTKLVIAFLALTVVPSVMMFAVASELISDTVDKWLSSKIEQTLLSSLSVAEGLYGDAKERVQDNGVYLSGLIERRGLTGSRMKRSLNRLIRQKLREYDCDLMQVYNRDFGRLAEVKRDGEEIEFNIKTFPEIMAKSAVGQTVTRVDDSGDRSLVVSVAPVLEGEKKSFRGVVVVARLLPLKRINQIESIGKAFEDFTQLTVKKDVIKASYEVTLALVALVIIFSAIWVAFYLAKGITVPLRRMLEATETVSSGDLSVRIDLPTQDDEVGQLVDAFNRMTNDLEVSKKELTRANIELTGRNEELHHWGQYTEAVLESVAAGVISINKKGAITTINNAAAKIFSVDVESARGKNYRKVFHANIMTPLRQMIREVNRAENNTISRELDLEIDGEPRKVRISLSFLLDSGAQYMGSVLVIDDLTDIIAAERSEAWQEMARMVAHEIKNPLTPIQLNVQRMRKKFEQGAEDFPELFDSATNTIIQEVTGLKLLVERFSKIAKMADKSEPPVERLENPFADMIAEPTSLNDIAGEVISLYQGTRAGIEIESNLDSAIGLVRIDPGQIKRLLINMVDNAIDAIDGDGKVSITTKKIKKKRSIKITVADTGAGIDESVKDELFTPHISSKEHGAGLGLAIVKQIVDDHGGNISVSNRPGGGASFIVELPVE